MKASCRAITSRRATMASLLGTTLLLATPALADSKACITAHATGQREAKAGHLRLATQLFTTCGSDETCPNQLRQECAEFLKSVEQTVPTVIFSVVDENNGDVSGVKVFSSEELLVGGLDGRAIQIDPGKHHLRFLLPSGEILNSDVLIREGEKNRLIEVKVKDNAETDATTTEKPPPVVAPPPPPPVAPPPAPPKDPNPPLGFWIASGVAVAGLGVGATYAIFGKSEKNDLSDCAPYCGENMRGTYDSLKRDYLIADIGFGVGVVSAGVATYLYVSSKSAHQEQPVGSRERTTPLAQLIPTVTVAKQGGYLSWSSSF